MIELEDITKVYDMGGEVLRALDGVTLTVERGEWLAIMGPSGCGKSTLLNILAGLQQATTGVVEVDGHPVDGPGRDRGVVFQTYTLFPWLTARQNVEFALHGEGVGRAERRNARRACWS